MTQLSSTNVTPAPRRTSIVIVAGLALASALAGGILGSRIQAIAGDVGQPAPVGSARDQALLDAGRDWEIRYHQMYPASR